MALPEGVLVRMREEGGEGRRRVVMRERGIGRLAGSSEVGAITKTFCLISSREMLTRQYVPVIIVSLDAGQRSPVYAERLALRAVGQHVHNASGLMLTGDWFVPQGRPRGVVMLCSIDV
jgi:hypothetical protein